jgi:C4-dicarboxylate transporter DctQ subunit
MQEQFGLQERVQRWVAYLILPVGLALLAFRSVEAFVQILTGKRELIIASHEAEDLVAENQNVLRD